METSLRQEGALGISMVRMSPEDAQQLDLEEPVDLIGLSGVPVKGKLKEPTRKTCSRSWCNGCRHQQNCRQSAIPIRK